MTKPFKVMVIGGTAESHIIIHELLVKNIEVIATVATAYGESLLQESPGLRIIQGRMDCEQMKTFISKNNINCLVDASHPFAANVSTNAIRACEDSLIDYVRYERESLITQAPDAIMAESYEEAADTASKIDGNIFLTTGSNNLEAFIEKIEDFKERLFVRVLPESSVILKCEKLGLTAGNIIAMKGPFSKELNKEMLIHCNIAVLITKESGDIGGVNEKIASASELGIKVVLIKRPKLDYRNVFDNINHMVAYVSKLKNII